MLNDFLREQILANFGFEPTPQQSEAIDGLCEFLLSPHDDEVFMLKGFAGTGKTSLISALVKTMGELERECALVAPTGRAAKVLEGYAEHSAFTIHKRIYRQKTIDRDSIFTLDYNLKPNILFICDEASMISNDEYLSGSTYGTGRLLDDLVHFIYAGNGCRLILLGDTAQLPPVGDGESPALREDVLAGYGLNVISHTLTEVVRQANESGILWNATRLRERISMEDVFDLPRIRFRGFPDVVNISGNDLIEALEDCYNRDGEDETIVVTRSNKRANVYNNGIRARILWREEQLESGDMLMVARNKYLTPQAPPATPQMGEGRGEVSFLANGDTCILQRVRNERQFYGFTFMDCELRFPDYDDMIIDTTVIADTLQAEAPALTRAQQDSLYNSIMEDYAGDPRLRSKADKMKALRQDPYWNALQIKYAYAITCHKAQGGQWTNVFVDQGYMTEDMLGPDYFRWLYTAITRATRRLFFVNWSQEQTDE